MGETTDPRTVVLEFWDRMAGNDFASVAPLLAPEFELVYPQSGERFDAAAMIRINTEYPSSSGRWAFAMNDLVAGPGRVVTDVSVNDGDQSARSIGFFTVADGLITQLTEYWPEPFAPPAWRTGAAANDH